LKNSSGIQPVGHRVLLKPDQIETKTASGIIVTTAAQEAREALAQSYGTVIAMGNTCYADQPKPWCKIGNRVAFAKYSGTISEGKDGVTYRTVNDLDIVSVVDEEVGRGQ
jgi:chaperonin GroES